MSASLEDSSQSSPNGLIVVDQHDTCHLFILCGGIEIPIGPRKARLRQRGRLKGCQVPQGGFRSAGLPVAHPIWIYPNTRRDLSLKQTSIPLDPSDLFSDGRWRVRVSRRKRFPSLEGMCQKGNAGVQSARRGPELG